MATASWATATTINPQLAHYPKLTHGTKPDILNNLIEVRRPRVSGRVFPTSFGASARKGPAAEISGAA